MVDIRELQTEADYDRALAEIAHYFDEEPRAHTPEAERFDRLAEVIAIYEAEHWPIAPQGT